MKVLAEKPWYSGCGRPIAYLCFIFQTYCLFMLLTIPSCLSVIRRSQPDPRSSSSLLLSLRVPSQQQASSRVPCLYGCQLIQDCFRSCAGQRSVYLASVTLLVSFSRPVFYFVVGLFCVIFWETCICIIITFFFSTQLHHR